MRQAQWLNATRHESRELLMHTRLVLAMLAGGAIMASIAWMARGPAATTSAAISDLRPYVYMPMLTKRYVDLPPPLEVGAVGWLYPRPIGQISICDWGTHYLQANDGQIVAWIRSQDGFPVDWDLYLERFVRVRGTAGPEIENCPSYIFVSNIQLESTGLPTATPAPSPTPPD
jgi:hypothetical protein